MFWNGNAKSGTCEYKRTVNQYCYPYDDSWCDNTGPVGQGLVCAMYANPYGSDYGKLDTNEIAQRERRSYLGICQCGTYSYYNGSALLGNGYCVAMRSYNQSCSSTSQCDYRGNLTCVNNLCSCAAGLNFNPSVVTAGFSGDCLPAGTYLDNCSMAFPCSTSQNLFCNLTYYGNANLTGICLCNSSWSYWDGLTCASKLSIGGQCTVNTQCIDANGLFCSNYTQTLNTCDCDRHYYWNQTCTLKIWYNQSCSSQYLCDDYRGLQCQGTGGSFFQKCDCFNNSYIWDSLYVTNQSYMCITKKTNGGSPCYGDLECQDFNYLVCNSGTCGCVYTDYWDGNRCQAKRNYTDICASTTQCRDFNPVDLVCRLGTTVPAVLQCLCNSSSYWSACAQICTVTKRVGKDLSSPLTFN